MPKGNSNKFRADGNGRTGLRDCPPNLREILQAYIETPSLLDGLPPSQRAQREEQIAAYEATRAMRSAATKAGWETRRAQKKLSVWELEDLHAAAAIEEAMVEARLAADSPSGWTFDDYFEEFVICQAWEVSLVLCEAAVATGRVSAEFVEETTARRFALDHRYDPEPASADGGADAEAEAREAKP
jgi:hypothetical protein